MWAFNEEVVVRAIASSAIPIVSAIGHETDYTLSDFAADHRAATPSQAAEIVVPDVKELVRYIYSLRKMLEIHIKNHVTEKNMRLNHSLQHRVFTNPKEFLAIRGQQLDIHIQKLYQELQTQIQNKKSQLFLLAEKLDVLNPLAVLGRGFSLTRSADKKNIVDSRQVVIGETLEVILSKGRLDVQVIKIRSEKNGKEKNNEGAQGQKARCTTTRSPDGVVVAGRCGCADRFFGTARCVVVRRRRRFLELGEPSRVQYHRLRHVYPTDRERVYRGPGLSCRKQQTPRRDEIWRAPACGVV